MSVSDDRSIPPARDQQPASPEPAVEDLGPRSFAGQNVAEDQRDQARERGAGLGAGDSRNRDARHPAQGEGEVAEDDVD